jgi:hypothetical protein
VNAPSRPVTTLELELELELELATFSSQSRQDDESNKSSSRRHLPATRTNPPTAGPECQSHSAVDQQN